MKNPNITNKLIQMMEAERRDKLQIISLIIEKEAIVNPNTYNPIALFNDLYDMCISELETLLNTLLDDIERRINEQIQLSLKLGGLEG